MSRSTLTNSTLPVRREVIVLSYAMITHFFSILFAYHLNIEQKIQFFIRKNNSFGWLIATQITNILHTTEV